MDKPETGDGKMIDNKQILTEKLSNSYSCENFRIQTTHVHACTYESQWEITHLPILLNLKASLQHSLKFFQTHNDKYTEIITVLKIIAMLKTK